ncbi:MAG: HEAT repeat domain-containing protein [Polyangiaceae bacterium]|nr:HEAT repeat domain-containing protein [Polyangiaceae bacterium]MCE7958746.1 HEAT repeat domain-containing protein [Acidobacteria bacterium ACB2]MCL4753138.1 HEAT repeat domain-containing protein [Myxococcales bacterium]
MGLFDFLSKGKGDNKGGAAPTKSDKEIARLGKLASQKLAQNYDRQEAIEELSRMATADSARALLRRFDFTMEPSITDQEEKESAARGIVAAGEAALDPIRDYCRKAESLTWPLKTLKDIVPSDSFCDELLAVLDLFDTEYVRNPEPKIQLIRMLEEFKSDEVRIAVEPFMTDASEPVRFSAVTTIFAVGMEESVPALVAALEEEESLRVKNRIAQGLADRDWSVPEELREVCERSLPPGFSRAGDKIRKD